MRKSSPWTLFVRQLHSLIHVIINLYFILYTNYDTIICFPLPLRKISREGNLNNAI